MSYIDHNLLPNEKVTYRTHLHWIIFARPVLWLLAAILFGIFITFFTKSLTYFVSYFHYDVMNIVKLLPFIIVLIAMIDGLSKYIAYITSEFGVTNMRVIVKLGFIRRTTSENFLQKVENIQVLQSIMGRILNYGTILLHGTGGTRELFYLIDRPLEFRRQIQIEVEGVLTKDPNQ